MTPNRLIIREVAPGAYEALSKVEAYIRHSGLEKSLIELVKMRASQINHCAYCMHMHSQDARKAGETEARLYVLPGWRESPLYSPRERAALAWTECLTRLPSEGAPEGVWREVTEHFTQQEAANLTVLIGMINLWNRFGVGFALQHPVAA